MRVSRFASSSRQALHDTTETRGATTGATCRRRNVVGPDSVTGVGRTGVTARPSVRYTTARRLRWTPGTWWNECGAASHEALRRVPARPGQPPPVARRGACDAGAESVRRAPLFGPACGPARDPRGDPRGPLARYSRQSRSRQEVRAGGPQGPGRPIGPADVHRDISAADRKSTRLNSSHSQISYAVFCLKKKKQIPDRTLRGRSRHPQPPRQLFRLSPTTSPHTSHAPALPIIVSPPPSSPPDPRPGCSPS